jgi:hypothetical protein
MEAVWNLPVTNALGLSLLAKFEGQALSTGNSCLGRRKGIRGLPYETMVTEHSWMGSVKT